MNDGIIWGLPNKIYDPAFYLSYCKKHIVLFSVLMSLEIKFSFILQLFYALSTISLEEIFVFSVFFC